MNDSFEEEEQRSTGSVWRRATAGDYAAFTRACLNTTGATLFTAGSAAYLSAEAEWCAGLFIGGNLCYIITGIWWAFASYHEFRERYMQHTVGSFGAAPLRSPNSMQVTLFHQRPIMVAGPGSVAPPFAILPPTLESRDIVQAFQALCWLDIFGAMCQVSGAVLYSVGCITQWTPSLYSFSIAVWSAGSAFFTLQGFVGHIMCTSFIGTWLTLIPRTHHYKQWLLNQEQSQFPDCCKRRENGDVVITSSYMHLKNACVHKCIPAALLNTVGSILFLIGSIVLAWDLIIPSGWCYFIGSTLFLVSNYSDGANIIDELYQRVTLEDKQL